MFSGFSISAQDIQLDTIICGDDSTFIFYAPRDTAIYKSEWLVNMSVDTLLQHSVEVRNNDTIYLISTLFDEESMSHDTIFDTYYIDLRLKPEFDFIIPDPICYNGDSIILIDNSNYFDSEITPTFTDETGSELPYNDTLSLLVENGDSITVKYVYPDYDCLHHSLDTMFAIKTLLQPTALFESEMTCENEFLTIINKSEYINEQTQYNFEIMGEAYMHTNNDDINFTFLESLTEGSYSISAIVDNSNSCIDNSTISVDIKEVTYVSFYLPMNEYCVNQDSDTIKADKPGGTFSGLDIKDLGEGMAFYKPMQAGNNITISYSLTNQFQCTDTDQQQITVHDRPELELSTLMSEYCELDPDVFLTINQNIENKSTYNITLDGQPYDSSVGLDYIFILDNHGSYEFTNLYEDENGCRDTLISTTIVHPLPVLELDSIITITPGDLIKIGPSGMPAIDYLWSNGSVENSIEVDQPGLYSLSAQNIFTMCEITDTIRIEYDDDIETKLIEISIHPNPTSDLLEINLGQTFTGIRMLDVNGNAINLNGLSIFSTDINGLLILDISNQSLGYYYLIIPNIGNFIIVKI